MLRALVPFLMGLSPEAPAPEPVLTPPSEAEIAAIVWGEDTSVYANDGECDDPRFSGPGASGLSSRQHVEQDASDCRTAFTQGRVRYEGPMAAPFTGMHDDVDFGDNSSGASFDTECDDPRFEGPGVFSEAHRRDVGRDADDCYRAYRAGSARFTGELAPPFTGVHDGVDFGDNSAASAFDDECDDPRFEGPGVFSEAHRRNVGTDADDCRQAVISGTARFTGELPPAFTGVFEGVDLGDNSSNFAFDFECDDRRFRGFGMARTPYDAAHERADADDCHALLSHGFIRFVGDAATFEGPHGGVDFGDNSALSAQNGVCDDPRFFGPGASRANDVEMIGRDAGDCLVAVEEGSARLREDAAPVLSTDEAAPLDLEQP